MQTLLAVRHRAVGGRAQLLRYLLVGVLNTTVGLGTIYLLLYILHLSDGISNFIGYCAGILLSFVLNKYWTFSNFSSSGPQFLRFALVTAAAYLCNLATVELSITFLRVSHYFAQAMGVLPYTAVGFLGSRRFAFRV